METGAEAYSMILNLESLVENEHVTVRARVIT